MVGEEITMLVKAVGWKKIVSGRKIFRSIPRGIMNEGLSSMEGSSMQIPLLNNYDKHPSTAFSSRDFFKYSFKILNIYYVCILPWPQMAAAF